MASQRDTEAGPSKGSQQEEEQATMEKKYLSLLNFVERDLDPSKRLARTNMQTLKEKIIEMAFLQAEITGENKLLKEQNAKIVEKNKLLKTENNKLKTTKTAPAASSMSYAKAAQKKRDALETTIQKVKSVPKTTLFITSKKGEDAKKVQETLTKVLNPAKDKIRVRAMRTSGKMLIVETSEESDAQKIISNKELGATLKCDPPTKRKPLMIIYDVPADMTDEDLLRFAYEQNFSETVEKSAFLEGFKLRFRAGPRDRATVHHVIEVDPNIRKEILKQGRLYLGFRSLSAKDYLVVPRCNKCQDLGHVAKYCHQEEVCGHCGKTGHRKNECPDKNRPKKCIPCQKQGKQCNQAAGGCATQKIMMDRLIDRTDYGI